MTTSKERYVKELTELVAMLRRQLNATPIGQPSAIFGLSDWIASIEEEIDKSRRS